MKLLILGIRQYSVQDCNPQKKENMLDTPLFALAFCLGSLSGPPCMVVDQKNKKNLPELSW